MLALQQESDNDEMEVEYLDEFFVDEADGLTSMPVETETAIDKNEVLFPVTVAAEVEIRKWNLKNYH